MLTKKTCSWFGRHAWPTVAPELYLVGGQTDIIGNAEDVRLVDAPFVLHVTPKVLESAYLCAKHPYKRDCYRNTTVR